MKSGISRYTLGGFNQTAMDDVYNKAKEIYTAEEPPIAGGIQLVTLDQLWDDMKLAHDARPLLSPYGHGQQQGAVIKEFSNSYFQVTPWSEIEEGATYGLTDSSVGCSTTWNDSQSASNSQNTVVEKGHSYLYALVSGVWQLVKQSDETWIGQDNPINENIRPIYSTPPKGCSYQWRAPQGGGCYHGASPDGFDTFMPGWTIDMMRNQGAYQHPFDSPSGRWNVSSNTTAICHITYYRLILKESNGTDDRHLSSFVTHQSGDAYKSSGSYIGDTGISRYKKVTNDWVANTMTTFDSSMNKSEFLAYVAELESILPKVP